MSETAYSLLVFVSVLLILPAGSIIYVVCAAQRRAGWALFCSFLGVYLSLSLGISEIRRILAGEVPGMGMAAAVVLSVLLAAVWVGVAIFYWKKKQKYSKANPFGGADPLPEKDEQ